jgi:hypothetical protein
MVAVVRRRVTRMASAVFRLSKERSLQELCHEMAVSVST